MRAGTEGRHRILRQSIHYSSCPSRFSPATPRCPSGNQSSPRNLRLFGTQRQAPGSPSAAFGPPRLRPPPRARRPLGFRVTRLPSFTASESLGFRVTRLPSRSASESLGAETPVSAGPPESNRIPPHRPAVAGRTRHRWADSDCDPWAGRVRVGRSLNRVAEMLGMVSPLARVPVVPTPRRSCARKRLPRASLLRKRDHAPSQLPSAVWPLSRVASPMPGFVLTRVTAGLNPLYSEPYSEPSDNLFPAPPLCCTPPSCGRWPLIVVYLSPLLHFP